MEYFSGFGSFKQSRKAPHPGYAYMLQKTFPVTSFSQTLTVLIIIITRSNTKTWLNGQRHATFSEYSVKQSLINNYGRRYGIPLIIACTYMLSSKFNSFTLYDGNVAATAATWSLEPVRSWTNNLSKTPLGPQCKLYTTCIVSTSECAT